MKNNNERNVLHERGGDVHEYKKNYIKIRQNNVSFLCSVVKTYMNTFSFEKRKNIKGSYKR